MSILTIKVNNVSKVYGSKEKKEIVVLKDINLTVNNNEFVCILGPSGCGKSTLLRIIAGLDLATKGIVEINGQAIDKPSKDSSVVFQEYALFPWRTVIENVELGLKLRHVSRKERIEKALKYLRIVNMDKFQNAFIHQLSGGMKQRVAIARALVLEPKILLMDEPFGALDTFTRIQLQDELINICKSRELSVVFVTHDIEEAVYLGDKIAIMKSNPGKINSLEEISLSKPRNRTDYDFISYRNHIYKEFSLVKEIQPEYNI
ncbi:ABC transporter ATP-binding protein [Clostridium pasteurianum]|uniref:ABC transporter ATP-binding protein n=1 Tax=Clostridium pasteurianum TaxID=1501 RepID=UPI001F372401|nr:ABC transporter ATP-binding protein [Clostridium pasteurianum]